MSNLTDLDKNSATSAGTGASASAGASASGFARMRGRLVEYARLMRLDRPIGI